MALIKISNNMFIQKIHLRKINEITTFKHVEQFLISEYELNKHSIVNDVEHMDSFEV